MANKNTSIEPSQLSPSMVTDEIETFMAKERKQPNRPEKNTFADVKSYKFHTNQLLYNNKQLTYLESHKQGKNTVPRSLLPDVKSSNHLTDTEKTKWQGILQGCGRQLRNLIIQHHQDKITEHKARREDLKRKIPVEEQQKLNRQITEKYETNKRRRISDSETTPRRTPEQNKYSKN